MTNEQPLTVLTLYENPTDYPGKFVVRKHHVYAGRVVPCEDLEIVVDATEENKVALFEQFSHLPFLTRNEGDEPQVVGCWI